MRRAVALAARGRRSASPRPVVGCVVLGAGGEVAGEGFFERGGEPHAEVNALRQAGELARGGTAVVTLEPCNHHGRTPPCSQALVAAGVARVVYAVADPNPVAAGGARTLRAAGVEVEGGVLEAEATLANEAWLTAMRLGRPFVTWKYAASLDGRIAAADGSSRWITGPEARQDGHRLRAESDAILVGSGTQRSDDPHLTVRGVDTPHIPLRVVADSGARTRAGARVLDQAAPTLLAVADDAEAGRLEGRAEILRLPRAEAGVDLDALLAALQRRAPGRLVPRRRADRPPGRLRRAGAPRRWRAALTGRPGRADDRGRLALAPRRGRPRRRRPAAGRPPVALTPAIGRGAIENSADAPVDEIIPPTQP